MNIYKLTKDFAYIYTPNRTYRRHKIWKVLGWESHPQQDRVYEYVSNVPDTLINMLYGLPDELRR